MGQARFKKKPMPATVAPTHGPKQNSSRDKLSEYREGAERHVPETRGSRDDINKAKLKSYEDWADVRKRA